MATRIPDERIPETEPWADRAFLSYCYSELGLSPRAIAYALGVSKSHITVYLERYGMTRKHRHEPTLRRLYVKKGLSADEIAARDEMDCSPVTVKRYLAEYGISADDPDQIKYDRLDDLGAESPSRAGKSI